MQELYKSHTRHWPFNHVMHNDTIQGDDWQDWEPLPPNETFSLYTPCPSTWPPHSPIRCSLIFVHLITKHQHFWVRHKICDVIHVDRMQMFIALQSLAWNMLVSEQELLKRVCKCSEWHFYTTVQEELLLYSSRYMVCCWLSSLWINERSMLVRVQWWPGCPAFTSWVTPCWWW